MLFDRLKLFDIDKISKYVWILEIYYIFSYLIMFLGHIVGLTYFRDVWNVDEWVLKFQDRNVTLSDFILLMLVLIITCLLILFFMSKYQKRNSKIYIYIVPIFIFISLMFTMFMIPAGLNFGLFGFSGALSFFIFIFILILFYDETPTNEKSLDLMHRRYLQFFNSFVWLVIIGGTWLIAFLLKETPPTKTEMFPIAFSIAAIQNLFVGGVGLLLVAYSFNERLRDIEKKLEIGSQKEK